MKKGIQQISRLEIKNKNESSGSHLIAGVSPNLRKTRGQHLSHPEYHDFELCGRLINKRGVSIAVYFAWLNNTSCKIITNLA
jgi:hypothetical protein